MRPSRFPRFVTCSHLSWKARNVVLEQEEGKVIQENNLSSEERLEMENTIKGQAIEKGQLMSEVERLKGQVALLKAQIVEYSNINAMLRSVFMSY